MLARKVYDMMHKKEKAEEIKRIQEAQFRGVRSLQDIAKDIVAENFERYPHLEGFERYPQLKTTSDRIKAEV